MVDVVLLAIPFFFLGIGVEWLVGRFRGMHIFRGADVAADLALAVMQTLAGILGTVALVGGYEYLYEHWRIYTVDEGSAAGWVALFLGLDLLYYCFHRAAHRVNIAWASHAPHHSSEDFNLAVALRQGPLQPFFSHVFYLPLAILGFSPEAFVFVGGVNTVYQFFIHTELVGKLGPLEWILNTPSHHRVHHGCNGRYLDRNHAGMLIIWDRMFGTFEPESDRPIYGTVKQVTTYNPLAVAVAPFADIAGVAARAPRFFDKLRVWFMPPEWLPPGVSFPMIDVVDRPKWNARPSAPAVRYVLPMFIVTLALVVAFLFGGASRMSTGELWLTCAWFTMSFTALGAVLDGRSWARPLEIARVVAFIPLLLFLRS